MAVNIKPMRDLREIVSGNIDALDALESHPVLAKLPDFLVHTEAIREHLKSAIAHISFVVEQYEILEPSR